jgi:hypothetical protein
MCGWRQRLDCAAGKTAGAGLPAHERPGPDTPPAALPASPGRQARCWPCWRRRAGSAVALRGTANRCGGTAGASAAALPQTGPGHPGALSARGCAPHCHRLRSLWHLCWHCCCPSCWGARLRAAGLLRNSTGLASRRLLTTVTGFTLGHSITLVLATLGWIAAPGWVEAAIAITIAISALLNLYPVKWVRGDCAGAGLRLDPWPGVFQHHARSRGERAACCPGPWRVSTWGGSRPAGGRCPVVCAAPGVGALARYEQGGGAWRLVGAAGAGAVLGGRAVVNSP